MSEATTEVPTAGVAAGAHLHRLLGTHPACAACTHRHRVSATSVGSDDLIYDMACSECPCTASGSTYDYGFDLGSAADFAAYARGHLVGLTGAERRDIDGHGGLGVHPVPRVEGQLHRTWRWRVSVRGWNLAVGHGLARASRGLLAGRSGRSGAEAVQPAGIRALDDADAVRTGVTNAR